MILQYYLCLPFLFLFSSLVFSALFFSSLLLCCLVLSVSFSVIFGRLGGLGLSCLVLSVLSGSRHRREVVVEVAIVAVESSWSSRLSSLSCLCCFLFCLVFVFVLSFCLSCLVVFGRVGGCFGLSWGSFGVIFARLGGRLGSFSVILWVVVALLGRVDGKKWFRGN